MGERTIEFGVSALFIDDYHLDRVSGLKRVLNRPRKYPGNPIMRPLAAWEGHAVNLFGSVIREGGRYRMWYQGYGGDPYTACYAESKDGVFWDRPQLGIVRYKGTTRNNIFMMDVSPVNVMRDDREADPSKRYKALFWEQKRPSMSVAFSSDGLRWSKYDGNPVMSHTSDVHMLMGFDERCGKYVAFTKPRTASDGRKIRTVARTESEDFIHWSEPVPILEPDPFDPPNLEFYGMPTFRYGEMYLGLPSVYHTYEEEASYRMAGTMDIQLAYSRDGLTWDRACGREVFIPNGPPSAVDSKLIYCSRAPVEAGDELWFYYGGYLVDHGITETISGGRPGRGDRNIIAQRGGFICLAKLRKEGFVSLDADETEGYAVTRPFLCQGGELWVNANASHGYLAVAVLDEEYHHYGDYYTGFKRVDCILADGDAIRQRITWRDHTDLEALKGKRIRLKFYMKHSKLYSYVLEPLQALSR